MEIIFRNGSRNVVADRSSRIPIKVKGSNDHVELAGFIGNGQLHPQPSLVKLESSGWRLHIDEPWVYSEHEEYILGVQFKKRVYAATNQRGPVIVV